MVRFILYGSGFEMRPIAIHLYFFQVENVAVVKEPSISTSRMEFQPE
jgi:hypothetical protein